MIKDFKKYSCKDCGNNFEQEVVKNSTVICPKCGKHNIAVEKNQNEKSTKPVS